MSSFLILMEKASKQLCNSYNMYIHVHVYMYIVLFVRICGCVIHVDTCTCIHVYMYIVLFVVLLLLHDLTERAVASSS